MNVYGYCASGPVGWDDPEGLKFKTSANYTPKERNCLRRDIALVESSPTAAGALLRKADADPKNVILFQPTRLRGGNRGSGHQNGYHNPEDPNDPDNRDETIWIDPCQTDPDYGAGKDHKDLDSPPDVTLAHEIGHHDPNSNDPASDAPVRPGDNVGKHENPYRQWRHLPKRYYY